MSRHWRLGRAGCNEIRPELLLKSWRKDLFGYIGCVMLSGDGKDTEGWAKCGDHPHTHERRSQKSFRFWSQSLKFGFRFHRHSLWGKRIVQTIQWFLVLNGPNRSGSEPKLKLPDIGAGAKNLDVWSWSRILKFEFWLHRPGMDARRGRGKTGICPP